jgi:hypothetical protein
MFRPRLRACAGSMMACVLVLSSCGGGDQAPAKAVISSTGFHLRVGDVSVDGGPAVAPEGTKVSLAVARHGLPTGELRNLLETVGDAVQIRFNDGATQPRQPVTISFAVDPTEVAQHINSGEVAVVFSQASSDQRRNLYRAHWDPPAKRMSAEVSHLSWFWLSWLQPRELFKFVAKTFTDALGLTYPRPARVGRTAEVGETTYKVDSVHPGVAWACVNATGSNLAVEIHSNSPLVWRVRTDPSAPGSSTAGVSLSGVFTEELYRVLFARVRDRESIVQPGGSTTFSFTAENAPRRGELVAEAGLLLTSSLIYGLSVAAKPFGLDFVGRVVSSDSAVQCLTGQVNTALDFSEPGGMTNALGEFTKATLDCLSTLNDTVIQTVVGIAIGGVSVLSSMIVGVVGELLGNNSATFNVSVQSSGVPLFTQREAASAAGSNGESIDATLAGRIYRSSTGMWVGCEGTAATTTYRLSGHFSRLRAAVGLQDHTPNGLTARIAISGDGRTLIEFAAHETETVPVDLAVNGIDTLVVAAIAQGPVPCSVSSTPYGALGDAVLVP